LTSDDSCNTEDHSRISMDVSRTCANHTLRESSVKPQLLATAAKIRLNNIRRWETGTLCYAYSNS